MYDECKPFLIGSVPIISRAMKIMGCDFAIHKIAHPQEARFSWGTLDVLEFQNIQRPPAKTGLLRMGNFMDSKIAAHDFHRPADNRYRADQERFALVIHAFVHGSFIR